MKKFPFKITPYSPLKIFCFVTPIKTSLPAVASSPQRAAIRSHLKDGKSPLHPTVLKGISRSRPLQPSGTSQSERLPLPKKPSSSGGSSALTVPYCAMTTGLPVNASTSPLPVSSSASETALFPPTVISALPQCVRGARCASSFKTAVTAR